MKYMSLYFQDNLKISGDRVQLIKRWLNITLTRPRVLTNVSTIL